MSHLAPLVQALVSDGVGRRIGYDDFPVTITAYVTIYHIVEGNILRD